MALRLSADMLTEVIQYLPLYGAVQMATTCRILQDMLVRDTVVPLLLKVPVLDFAGLRHPGYITTHFVTAALRSSTMQGTVMLLDVCDCRLLDGVAIREIPTRCPSLRSIRLGFWSRRRMVTGMDQVLQAIAENCSSLASLAVYNCDITDNALKVIAQKCQNVTTLNVVGCLNITEGALKEIARICHGLDNLVLTSGQHLKSREAVFEFATKS